MSVSAPLLSASEAARRLGVSPKALRLYEQRGLVVPGRSAAGYRVYGVAEMARAAEVVALRALGLSHRQVARVLEGDSRDLERALATHEAVLEGEVRKLTSSMEKVRRIRAGHARGEAPVPGELAGALKSSARFDVAFDLPWPWGGERFELRDVRPINYIVGPLGSGKTRLARALAEAIPGGVFLGLERAETALPIALDAEGIAALVVDMVEQGLDRPAQEALIAELRQRARASTRPLFLMTRSSSILDLAAIGPDESILFCPANHSPPICVAPYPGAAGYEGVATCLASPEVRARTAGMLAVRAIDSARRESTPAGIDHLANTVSGSSGASPLSSA